MSAKRRRLNDPSGALSKPFKSPLRADRKASDSTADKPNPLDGEQPSGQGSRAVPPSKALRSTASSPLLPTTPLRQHAQAQLRSSPTKDPTLLSLQRQHSQLLSTLSSLRNAFDTAQQALKIESSNTDVELESLITKWRHASREAAEEVFRGAKDRVNRMGGVGAWRERTRKKPNVWDGEETNGFDQDIDEDALTPEQKEELDRRREELEEEREIVRRRKMEEEAEEQIRKEPERDDEVSILHLNRAGQ